MERSVGDLCGRFGTAAATVPRRLPGTTKCSRWVHHVSCTLRLMPLERIMHRAHNNASSAHHVPQMVVEIERRGSLHGNNLQEPSHGYSVRQCVIIAQT